MLIKAYGQFWNPDIIDWGNRGAGNKGKLLGKGVVRERNSVEVDFWEAKGVYVLHKEFQTIYVGQAFSDSSQIGKRLRDHLTDRFAGRWDMFSWFTLSTPLLTGGVRSPGARHLSPETVSNTLEALLILVANPELNRKRERFEGAEEFVQKSNPNPHTVRSYLERILNEVSRKGIKK